MEQPSRMPCTVDDERIAPGQDPRSTAKETVSHPCGWCGQSTWARLVGASWAGFKHSYGPGYRSQLSPRLVAVYQCSADACQNASLLVWTTMSNDGWLEPYKLEYSWPSQQAREMDDLTDQEIQWDRIEAWNAYHQNLPRASILMARSALQRTARRLLAGDGGDLNASDKGTLNSELDRLAERGVLTEQLRANADEVRLSGNDVAHPEEMEPVTMDDAHDSLVFLDDFLQTTMTIPERQRARKAEREAEKE